MEKTPDGVVMIILLLIAGAGFFVGRGIPFTEKQPLEPTMVVTIEIQDGVAAYDTTYIYNHFD